MNKLLELWYDEEKQAYEIKESTSNEYELLKHFSAITNCLAEEFLEAANDEERNEVYSQN